MTQLYTFLHTAFKSEYTLLFVESFSFLITTSIIIFFILKFYNKTNKENNTNYSFLLFIITIMSLSIENLSWIIKLFSKLHYITIPITIIRTSSGIAWIFNMLRYQSLGYFLETLVNKDFSIKIYHKLFLVGTTILSSILMYGIIYQLHHEGTLPPILHKIFPIIPPYSLITIIPSICITFTQLFNPNVPKLIRAQLKIIYGALIFPHFFFEFVQMFNIFSIYQETISCTILSSIFINIALIFIARTIFNLRFLNTTHHISTGQSRFNNEIFKEAIEQVTKASHAEELGYITQRFFNDSFKTPIQTIHLHIRNISTQKLTTFKEIQTSIENFITSSESKYSSIEILHEQKVIVLDEIEFNAFYTSQPKIILLTNFLKSINCSVFVPIFYKNELIAYITIIENESHHFFNLHEQNDIYILGNYLAHMIHMINTTNPQTILKESQLLKQELFLKHQEINQYKECMKNLLKKNVNHATGIIFYKNNHFFFGNKAAQDLVQINLNQQKKHPLTLALLEVAEQVISFKSTQIRFLTKQNNEKLLITGIPHIETKDTVILTIQYPEASDIIKKNLNKLQNPSKWDYALYLETTKSGQLINKLVPSNQENFFHFKINLLEAALTHKGLLLQCHPDDLLSIADLIHRVSLKETLHVIDLQGAESKDIYIKLFSINPLFSEKKEASLLQKLDKDGTLLIKNIEQLDHETQRELANFISYGYFSPFKSHEKIFSSVRIIASTNQNPQVLIERGLLLVELYNQLHSTVLKMPSLVTLKDEEIQELVDGVTYHSVNDKHFAHLIQLSDTDYQTIIDNKPASLQELKTRVHNLLAKKTNTNNIFIEKALDPQLETSNPELLHAAQLGKYALKDEKLMALLWSTFKSQARIAQFLGVNRSSVNRRCKEYSLN